MMSHHKVAWVFIYCLNMINMYLPRKYTYTKHIKLVYDNKGSNCIVTKLAYTLAFQYLILVV